MYLGSWGIIFCNLSNNLSVGYVNLLQFVCGTQSNDTTLMAESMAEHVPTGGTYCTYNFWLYDHGYKLLVW